MGQDGPAHGHGAGCHRGLSLAFRYLREGGIWFDDPQADQYDERGGIVHIPAVASGEPASAAAAG
ncbi:hypothetical protein GCM10020219_041120 [Nonomuraea dietziae]